MPRQYLHDITNIMADRPIPDEQPPTLDEMVPGLRRAPERDVKGVEIWEAPSGDVVAVASPQLKAWLRRKHRTAVKV